jgi:hypothetical protein
VIFCVGCEGRVSERFETWVKEGGEEGGILVFMLMLEGAGAVLEFACYDGDCVTCV